MKFQYDFCLFVFLLEILHVKIFVNSETFVSTSLMGHSAAQRNLQKLPKEAGIILSTLDEEYSLCGVNKIDIRELTIAKVQMYFETGQLSSTALTLCYLQRIEQMNPILKAVIEVNPEATKIAIQSDLDRLIGISHSPLHGIPILIKDNIATLDLMHTTAGAIAMEFLKPLKDADVVKKLRSAGAVILGKTNPSEWAYYRGDIGISGWSGRGGKTLSPYVLSESPSGSSTGSAVAVGANLAMIALGTETDGSILGPSSRGSIVGLKTTFGAVSTAGSIPLAFSMDVIGPMARTTVDAAILMEVIAKDKLGDCGYNLETCLSGQKFKVGIFQDLSMNNSANASEPISPPSPTDPVIETFLKTLKEVEKITIVDSVKGDSALIDNITFTAEDVVFAHEFKHGVNKYINDVKHLEFLVGRRISKLSDIIQFNKANPPPEDYNDAYLIAAEATDGINNQTYIQLRDQNKKLAQKFLENVLNNNTLDAIATPCFGSSVGSKYMPSYSLGAMAGYPSISVPMGVDDGGMPVGICILGKLNSETVLLKIAYLIETAASMRQIPYFKS